jgi:hypothetical protein
LDGVASRNGGQLEVRLLANVTRIAPAVFSNTDEANAPNLSLRHCRVFTPPPCATEYTLCGSLRNRSTTRHRR